MSAIKLRRNASAWQDMLDAARLPAFGVLLALIFLTGGGSRGDISSLAVLRPLCALVMMGMLAGIRRDQLRDIRWPLILIAGLAALTAIQLVPLPPAIWTALPGRAHLVDALTAAGLPIGWHGISLSPTRSWNALFALMVPAAVLLAYARLDSDERRAVPAMLIVIGLASALLGLLQLIGPRRGLLYLYDITNNGSAVGLFANRNHQAVLLASLFPLLGAWLLTHPGSRHSQSLRQWAVFGICAALIPLLMATGSRAGLLFGVVGLLSLLAFMPAARFAPVEIAGRDIAPKWLLVGAVAVMTPILLVFASRLDALERFSGSGMDEELRFSLIKPVSQMIMGNLPLGGGVGTFSDIYKRYEPDALINWSYVNHAHNDLIEFLYEGGVAAAVLLALGGLIIVRGARRVWAARAATTPGEVMARAALVGLAMLLASSLVDYPLRVPSMASLAVIMLAWLTAPAVVERPSVDVDERRRGGRAGA